LSVVDSLWLLFVCPQPSLFRVSPLFDKCPNASIRSHFMLFLMRFFFRCTDLPGFHIQPLSFILNPQIPYSFLSQLGRARLPLIKKVKQIVFFSAKFFRLSLLWISPFFFNFLPVDLPLSPPLYSSVSESFSPPWKRHTLPTEMIPSLIFPPPSSCLAGSRILGSKTFLAEVERFLLSTPPNHT